MFDPGEAHPTRAASHGLAALPPRLRPKGLCNAAGMSYDSRPQPLSSDRGQRASREIIHGPPPAPTACLRKVIVPLPPLFVSCVRACA